MNSDEDHLRQQARQLREAILSIENKNNGRTGMRPEELWTMVVSGDDPLHPRLQQMLHGHVNIDSLKTGLARLENDLDSLQGDLHDSPAHEIDENRID